MATRILPVLFVLLLLICGPPAWAQDSGDESDDGSSTQVEESDESYRRRMELEDARQRDPLTTPPPAAPRAGQEKLDKLPAESRDNIRQQLVDVIIENGEWEPFDALREYPYTPTAAAEGDPDLLAREQEAWEEQLKKYHDREAEAYAASRGPPPSGGGPDGPMGQPGDPGASEGQQGEPGQPQTAETMADGQQSGEGQSAAAASAGSYQPYESSRNRSEEAVSTAGAQQSALDFLRGQGQAPSAPQAEPASAAEADLPQMVVIELGAPQQERAEESADAIEEATEAAATELAAAESETTADSEAASDIELDLETPGIIAIEDLDKLEGTEAPNAGEDGEEDQSPAGPGAI